MPSTGARSQALVRPSDSPLRAARISRELTLADLAQRSGVEVSHLSRIERREVGASIDTLLRIASALGLSDLAEQLAPYATPHRPRRSYQRRHVPSAGAAES